MISGLLEQIDGQGDDIVIVSHSYAFHKECLLIRDVLHELRERSIPFLTFDYSGCGDSEGDFASKTITSFCEDLGAAVAFAHRNGYTGVHLFGASGGATISMAYTLQYPQAIRSLALKSPVWNYFEQRLNRYGEEYMEQWKREGVINYKGKIPVKYSFIEDVLEHWNLHIRAGEIDCPTLIVHGTRDEEVAVESSHKGYKMIKNSVYVEINGADHNLCIDGKRTCSGGLIAGWIKDQIVEQTTEVHK